VTVQDLADDLRAHHGAALAGPLGGAVHELAFQHQQLRRGEPLDPKPPVTSDPDRPLRKEPVSGLLGLGERLGGEARDGQALGQRIHHVGAGERARLGREPLGAGQLLQGLAELLGGGRSTTATLADLGELPLTHPLLSKLGRPPHIHALLALAVVPGRPRRHRCRA
jgi:hypothetical protein